MRKLRNTLYITTPDSYLARENDCLLVCREGEKNLRVPALNLEGIVTFGYQGASPAALELCAEKGITVTYLNPNGRFLSRVEGPLTGNILLRRRQYRLYDLPDGTKLAARMVAAKIANCRVLLLRGLRDHPDIAGEQVGQAAELLKRLVQKAFVQTDLDVLRGVEGEAARCYFGQFNHLVVQQRENFQMQTRNRRPPTDRINCLLSYLYTLLVHECRAACETVGLDPSAGYLHRDRPGRPSLALDLMEELRPVFADRMALSLVNRLQITDKDFEIRPNGAVLLQPEAKKVLLNAWQKRKQETITHPFLEEKMEFGLIPYAQALLLARFLRGDLDDYPAFLWR